MCFTSSHVERNTFLFLPCSPCPCTCSCSHVKPCFLSQTNAVIFCLHRAVVLVFSSKYYEVLDWVFVFLLVSFCRWPTPQHNFLLFEFSHLQCSWKRSWQMNPQRNKKWNQDFNTFRMILSRWLYIVPDLLIRSDKWFSGLPAAISFLIVSLFINVLKLLAMTCLILLYTKIYIWKINLTQNLYEIYWRSYIFTEKWDGEGFFETTRSSRRATGTSTKVTGERDVL